MPLLLLTVVYALNRHYIRPYINANVDSSSIQFLFGILPNFLGAIIMFIFFRYIVLKSVKGTFLCINIYIVCHELLNFLTDNINFDFYDILATVTATVVMSLIDFKITSSNTDQNDSTFIDKLFKL